MFREPAQKGVSSKPLTVIDNPSRWYLGGEQFLRDISREASDDVIADYAREYLEIIAEPADGEAAGWTNNQREYDAVQQAFGFAFQQCPYTCTIPWKGLENDESIAEFEQLAMKADLPSIEHHLANEYGDTDHDGMLDMVIAEELATLFTPLGWTIGSISLSIDRNYFIAPKDVTSRYSTTAPIPFGPDMEASKEPYSGVVDWDRSS